jgi:hypothetical protein
VSPKSWNHLKPSIPLGFFPQQWCFCWYLNTWNSTPVDAQRGTSPGRAGRMAPLAFQGEPQEYSTNGEQRWMFCAHLRLPKVSGNAMKTVVIYLTPRCRARTYQEKLR